MKATKPTMMTTMRPKGLAPAPGTNPQTKTGGSGTAGNMTPAQKKTFGTMTKKA